MEHLKKSSLLGKVARAALAALLAVAFTAPVAYANPSEADLATQVETQAKGGEVAVVFTNDVHCAVDDGLGYAGVAAFVDDAEAEYGADNVVLVDAGDAVQGGPLGTLTGGEAVVGIMTYLGYDYAVPGNHEFDYGMDQFNTFVQTSSATYLSCNFVYTPTGATVLAPYDIRTYGGVADAEGGTLEVAYVGISTPETLTKSSPASFQDETGAYVYGFCQDESGEALYAAVQSAVDAARAAGADYVIAIGHLGQAGITDAWTSTAVVANTTGIDALIDGHSHEQYVQTATNAAGESVPIAQTGTKLASAGKLVIDPDADEAAGEQELSLNLATAENYTARDADAQAYIDGVNAEFAAELERVVGTSEVDLLSEDAETGLYVRYQETNLGDFVADAYRTRLGADVGLANGGGVRSSIAAGDVTYYDLMSVQPFGNELCLVEVTGQVLLDALEMGVSEYPEPSGGFLQVSGVTFTVRTDIPSSVALDEFGNFAGVEGAYRVQDVKVNGEPLDPSATYTVASHGYMLLEGGDGMTMFTGCTVLLDSVMIDNQALIDYTVENLGGVIGAGYENPEGAGRITFSDGTETPDPDPVPGEDENPDPTPGDPGTDKPVMPGTSNTGTKGGASSKLPQTGDALGSASAALAATAFASALVALAAAGVLRRKAGIRNR